MLSPPANGDPRRASAPARGRRAGWLLAALLGLGLPIATATAAEGPDPGALLRAIRTARLERQRAVSLRHVEIDLGPATLSVERGFLVPAAPIEGRTLEMVLIGQAVFRAEPPDAIEAGQLELFTGRPRMDMPVEEAVLVLADEDQVARLLDRPPAEPQAEGAWTRAEELYERWIHSVERASVGAEAGMFKALCGDRPYREYFALWCAGHETSEFVYANDPEEAEPLTVAAFIRPGLRGWDRIRLARHLRHQQRNGRYLGLRVEDIGAWDLWLSTHGDRAEEQGSGFEARHYELDATILRKSLRLEGRAVLHLEATASGRRTVSLELFRDLEVERVVDGSGTELFAFRSGPEIVVQLPRPSQAGERFTLEVHYGGRALEWVGKRVWDLQSTTGWYPQLGSVARSTYDVTLRWPHRHRLFAGGIRVAGGRTGHYRWERRVIDRPAIASSFVLGRFDVAERQAGHVRVTLAFDRASGQPSDKARERTFDVITRALAFFEQAFGPYPLDELTVVVLPRDYSQSFLGYVTLTDTVTRAAEAEPYAAGAWIRETTVAHEIAHQWWGNLIGWQSYRDQWLSEAMANYAGLLFHASSNDDVSLADLSAGWRATLERTVPSGRTIESLGPVVLGSRLNSSQAANGYAAIVYRKGAVVLAMLARVLGQDRFLAMLRELVHTASGSVITTEGFLEALERMSGTELDGFARQYVYGTGIPLVYYDYDVRPGAEGQGWLVSGEAHRLLEPGLRSRLARRADGSWDVVREPGDAAAHAAATLIVPFRVVLADSETDSAETYRGRARTAQSGQLTLTGDGQPFEIETATRPLRVDLDPDGEILAEFHARETSPKRWARYRGQDLIVLGRLTEAERELELALSTPVGETRGRQGSLPWMRDPAREQRREDLAIRIALARLYLDQGRDDEGERQLRLADQLAGADGDERRVERDTLWSRLDLRRGHAAQAYRRLKQTMRMAAPRHEPQDPDVRLAQLRLRSELLAFSEAYALFAVAARETGNVDDYRWALDGARERGVDTTLLEQEPAQAAHPGLLHQGLE